jgi:hypothetical protein
LGFTAVAKATPQPNIVFFFADDQTSSSLGCYGHPLAQTPHLDRPTPFLPHPLWSRGGFKALKPKAIS